MTFLLVFQQRMPSMIICQRCQLVKKIVTTVKIVFEPPTCPTCIRCTKDRSATSQARVFQKVKLCNILNVPNLNLLNSINCKLGITSLAFHNSSIDININEMFFVISLVFVQLAVGI